MAILTFITTVESEEIEILNTDQGEILDTLGEEKNIAVQLKELFSSVTEEIADNIKEESKLTIEITGSVNIKAKGDVKYLFFNAGAEAGKTTGMKVVFSTTLKPKTESTQD